MKDNIISYTGIRTNNLKGFSIDIPVGCFWGIAGPSGSGKSSLAYGTIYAISQYEWEKVANNIPGAGTNFEVDSYQNIIPAIALKQNNQNTNPRSTVATFLRIDKDFRLLFASANAVSPSMFSFNNPKNACSYCDGLGVETHLDSDQMIDWEKSISEKPFLPWRAKYNQKVLEKYAQHKGIPLHVQLKNLKKEDLDDLLYGQSRDKFRVSYAMNGKKRTREFQYIGLLLEMQSLKADKEHVSSNQKLADYSSAHLCSHCHGTRFSEKVLSFKYRRKSLGELYTMELSDLSLFINQALCDKVNNEHEKLLCNIKRIVDGLIQGKLEYLSLNRSIPSLSGGELQRIRLVNILTSQISGMLYIIDEPSARLHVSEYNSIINALLSLRNRRNSILMIEHNPFFLERTDRNLFIGPGSGDNGGELVNSSSDNFKYLYIPKTVSSFFYFEHISANNLHNVSVRIPQNCITGIYGPSGSGKSTLVRCIEKNNKNVEYVSQKPLRGSVVSTIASYCGVLDDIRDVYARESNLERDFFSFTSEKGQCPFCKGRGSVKYSLDFGKTEMEVLCDECKGKRYSNEVLKYSFKGFSIYEMLTLTIDHLLDKVFFAEYPIIAKKVALLQKLGLGYLTLFRTTDTLSGGEAQRLKLTKFIGKKLKGKIFIFDEPLTGLNEKDAYNIMAVFNEITEVGGTAVFVEHNVLGISACDYILEMGPGKGKYGGKVIFEGDIEAFKQSNNYLKYHEIMAI